MHTGITYRQRKPNKQMEKLIKKAENELKQEIDKQLDIIVCSMIIALYRHWNYRTDRLTKIMNMHQTVWDECGADSNMSMIRKCDEECDIELTNQEGVSYRKIQWLNDAENLRPLNDYEWLIFRQNQKKWTKAQMLACVCLSIHRTEGWGFNRLQELMLKMDDIAYEFEDDPKKLCAAVVNECKYNWTGEEQKAS